MLIYQFSKMERLDAWRVKLSPPFWGQSAGFVAAAPSILQSGTLSEERRRPVESSLTLKPSCILPRAFREGYALRLRAAISSPSLSFILVAFRLPFYPYSCSLPSSFPPSLFSLSLSFCSLSPSLARLFQYSIFIIRFQLLVSRIVWLGRVRSHSIE